MLCENYADVNIQDKGGSTPLHAAAYFNTRAPEFFNDAEKKAEFFAEMSKNSKDIF